MSDQNSNSPVPQTPGKKNPAAIVIAVVLVLFFIAAFVPIPWLCFWCKGSGLNGHCGECGGSGAMTVWKRMNH